jgi:hypothetical protein
MLEALPAEQQQIAQQLLRGGIPAVRTALHFERERAREEGRPEPSIEGIMALAESLLSRVKAAEWRDKAEAAIKAGDDLAMRDLRSLVTGSDVARDGASRDLAVALREALERRVESQWTEWASEVAAALDAGHVGRALDLSSRPPDIAARFPADLATRLRDAASAALSPDRPADQWLRLLESVVASPVRRTVKPAGLPAGATPELLETARQHCGRVPALAGLLGLSVPPPPGPVRAMPAGNVVAPRVTTRRLRARPRPAGASTRSLAREKPSVANGSVATEPGLPGPTKAEAEPTLLGAEAEISRAEPDVEAEVESSPEPATEAVVAEVEAAKAPEAGPPEAVVADLEVPSAPEAELASSEPEAPSATAEG